MQGPSWARCARVCTGNVTEAVQKESLERDGTWSSDEAANPRGVKGPACKHP